TDAWQRVRAALVLVRSAFVVAAVVPVVIAFHGFERGDELALLFVAEAGVGVQQGVPARRHGAFGDGLGGVGGVAVVAPFGEVELVAACIDVASHEPRHRGHVAVDGPVGLVAVTGLAGGARQAGCLLVGPGGVGAHGRVAVAPPVGDGLHGDEDHDSGD